MNDESKFRRGAKRARRKKSFFPMTLNHEDVDAASWIWFTGLTLLTSRTHICTNIVSNEPFLSNTYILPTNNLNIHKHCTTLHGCGRRNV